MAQTRRKRSRKHRGTQAGTVETPSHRAGSRTKAAAKPKGKSTREDRLSKPPTWKGAITRAAIAAVVFAVIVAVFVTDEQASPATRIIRGLGLGLFAFVLYVPTGYYIDRFLYNRRQRQKAGGGKKR